METNKHSITCPNCGHICPNKKPNHIGANRIPRGKHLPQSLIHAVKITEDRNTLRAIAYAYSVDRSDLGKVISGKRNTKRLIEILEFEYKRPIAELRELFYKAKNENIELALKTQEEASKGESKWP